MIVSVFNTLFMYLNLVPYVFCYLGSGEEKPQQWNELYYEGILSFPE